MLTVPKAGVIAGRAAQVGPAPVLQTGAALANLGQNMETLATKVLDARARRKAQDMQLDMTTDFALARQQVAQLTDPAAVGPAWDQALVEIRGKYLPTDADGNSALDPRVELLLGPAFKDLAGQHTVAIAGQQTDLDRSAANAAWLGQRDRMTTAAVNADPETFAALRTQGLRAIDDRLAAGLLKPDEAEAERQRFLQDVTGSFTANLIGTDPQGFLDRAAKGEFNELGATGLAEAQKVAAKQLEVGRSVTDSALIKRLHDMAKIIGKDRTAADEAWLASPELARAADANPDLADAYGAALAAKALRDETPGLKMATIPELETLRAKEAKRTPVADWDTKRLDVIDQLIADKRAGYANDPIATAAAENFNVPPLPAFDPANPQAFATALAPRLAFAVDMVQQGRAKSFQPLTVDEAAQLKPVLDPKADVGPKLALAASLAQTAGPAGIGRLAPAMGGDPTFTWAAEILATTGNAPLAEGILRGTQKAALGNVTLPPEKDLNGFLNDVTGGLMDSNPTMFAQVKAAAAGLYADRAAGINPDGKPGTIVSFSQDTEAQDTFKAAVAEVTGARPDANGDLTIGGIQDINGTSTWLPPGIGRDDVEGAIQAMGYQLGLNGPADWDNQARAQDHQAVALEALKSASLDGFAPDLGGPEHSADLWQTVQFERVGKSNIYEAWVTANGQRHKVYRSGDPTMTAWRFDLTRLLAAVPQ